MIEHKNVIHKSSTNFILRILYYFITQLRMFLNLINAKDISFWIFFIGGETLLLPLIGAKLNKKKVLMLVAGFPSRGSLVNADPFFPLQILLSKFSFNLSNKILVYSEKIILERNIRKINKKVLIFRQHFINLDDYKNSIMLTHRPEIIGYLGGIEILKGIKNFIYGVTPLLKENKYLKVIIAGEGDTKLTNELIEYSFKQNISENIYFKGWIDPKDVPEFLNGIKYLIIPSYTEGLPNVILEGMASGVCIISTSVGAITDVIIDGKTGFLLKDNNPSNIIIGIKKAMNYSNLNEISENAKNFIKLFFSYEYCLKNFKKILEKL